jgi:phosphatidate cytidylyltransferase
MSRIITALIALPVLIASILIESLAPLFVALAAAAMVLGLYEFWFLARKREMKPDIVVGYAGAAALFTIFYFNAPELLTIILPLLVIAALVAAMLRGAPFDKMISSVGATVLGVLYVALLGGHLLAVRVGFRATLAAHLLSFFFLVIMGSDTGAYYTGKSLGRHKLAHFWFFRELNLGVALGLAALMNVLGVCGDLTESALKRGAGAKDAAHILPGHGGLLDRLDSLLFNAPVIYYFGIYYFGRLYFKQ